MLLDNIIVVVIKFKTNCFWTTLLSSWVAGMWSHNSLQKSHLTN